MKNQRDFLVGALLVIVFALAVSVGWIKDIIHLAECDFKSPYKAEIVYSIGGFVPPIGMVVGWMDLGK